MIYLKKFNQHTDYQSFLSGGGLTKPNVSFCASENEVHFIPYDPEYLAYATFWGKCKAKTVNCYWGAGSGTDNIFYTDNYDGTYNFYCINDNKAKQWWDRFVWYNSDDVLELYCQASTSNDTRNNRFNSESVEKYDFGTYTVTSNDLHESFYNCQKLKEIDLSGWVLSGNTHCYAAFSSDYELQKISLPAVVCSSGCTLAHKMFGWNRELVTIEGMTSPNFSNVTDFSEMFCECEKLQNIDFTVNNWVTDKATDLHSMFLKCNVDESILGDFTTWDTKNVTTISGIFANNKWENINISGWDLSNCTNVSYAFQDGLHVSTKSINLSGVSLNPDKIEASDYMFDRSKNVESITLTNCTDTVINFIKGKLVVDIPDRITSDEFSLVLNDGNYNYDAENSAWKKKN